MYSQCPECQARFRVTAAALRAARGTVRCGRCGAAFDALERLSDSLPPAAPEHGVQPLLSVVEEGPSPGPGPDVAVGDDYHFSAEDLDQVFVDARQWPVLAVPQPATGEPITDPTEPPVVVVDERVAMEDITLEGERIQVEPAPELEEDESPDLDSTDEFEVLRQVPDSAYPEEDEETQQKLQALVQQLAAKPIEASPGETPDDISQPPAGLEAAALAIEPEVTEISITGAPRPAEWGAVETGAVETATAEPLPAVGAPTGAAEPEPVPLSARRWRRPEMDEEPAPVASEPSAGSGFGTFGWALLGLVLALVLAAQLVHHFRQDLVRHPQVGPVLRAAYERLGLELSPNWDLGAFELRQWGNDAGTAGRMVVRASLTNRAPFPQPHPILRLELEDRFGNPVASRDFEPADYLKNPSQATRLIDPGASSEAELAIAATGRDAVGYRLDVCLRESATQLRCANGPG
jgi:predicted Zn finger-like uncharacterized protein